jgi:hypothetical protein
VRDRHVRRGLFRRKMRFPATDFLLFHVRADDLVVPSRNGARWIFENVYQVTSPYTAGAGGFGGIAPPGAPACVVCAAMCGCIRPCCNAIFFMALLIPAGEAAPGSSSLPISYCALEKALKSGVPGGIFVNAMVIA